MLTLQQEIKNSLISGNDISSEVATLDVLDTNADGIDEIVVNYGAGVSA